MTTIALDIGGTKISGAVFTEEGIMLNHQKRLLEHRTGGQVAELAAEIINRLLTDYPTGDNKNALGICIPGIVFSEKETVWAPNIPGWDDFPLKKILRQKTGIPGKDIFMESDRTCSILGEIWKGAAIGCSNALFIAVGTGIGLGIIIDGRIVHGFSDIVGATGWMALKPPHQEEYDSCGCFEYFASGNGIGARARDLLKKDPDYKGALREKKPEEITAHDVFLRYPENDPVAKEVLGTAIEMWGMAAANLVSLFNPEKIIWGGGIFGPGGVFLDDIYREALKWAQPISIRQVTFEVSRLGENAGLYGAARLTLVREGRLKMRK